MKKLLFKLSVFLMCISTISTVTVPVFSFTFNLPNFSENSYTLMLEDVNYEVLNEDEISISLKTKGPIAPKVVIPDALEINGKYYSIASLEADAFSYCDWLKEIDIPESVKYICRNSFGDCVNLTKVVCRGNISAVGVVAFLNCSSLENICFYGNVQKFLSDAFGGCEEIKEVFYYGVINPEISESVFNSKEVVVHTLDSYQYNNFGDCDNLKKDLYEDECSEDLYEDELSQNSNEYESSGSSTDDFSIDF